MRRQRSNCGLRCLVPKPQWICGRQSKSSPSLHSLGFFFSLLVRDLQATFGSSKTQFQSSPICVFQLKESPQRFSGWIWGKKERKENPDQFLPYSLFLPHCFSGGTPEKDGWETRHQSYWPCDKCCQRSSMRVRVTLWPKTSQRTRSSCYLQAPTVLTSAEIPESSQQGKVPREAHQERRPRESSPPIPLLPKQGNCTSGARQLTGTQHGAHQTMQEETWPLDSICKMLEVSCFQRRKHPNSSHFRI